MYFGIPEELNTPLPHFTLPPFMCTNNLWNDVVHSTNSPDLLRKKITDILCFDYIHSIDKKKIIQQLGYNCITCHRWDEKYDAWYLFDLIEIDIE